MKNSQGIEKPKNYSVLFKSGREIEVHNCRTEGLARYLACEAAGEFDIKRVTRLGRENS